MRQAILERPERIVFREVERPEPGPGQVLVRIRRIGICGSDIHAYYGKHPYIRCPIVQGHEFSGEIAEVGPGVRSSSPGDRVTVRPQLTCGTCYPCVHGEYHICNNLRVIGCQAEGAAQEFLTVDAKLVVPIPEAMTFDEGAMIEPLAVGVHALARRGSVEGLRVLVLGAGPIGNLTAQAAQALGSTSVMITDISDHRLRIARECGIDFQVHARKEDLARAIAGGFGPEGADAILECVGSGETLGQAVRLARKGTDIIIVGVFGEKTGVDIGLVQDRELRLIGTLMYKAEDYETAIELIRSGEVRLEPLITRHFPFDQYPQAYRYIETNREQTMKILIDL